MAVDLSDLARPSSDVHQWWIRGMNVDRRGRLWAAVIESTDGPDGPIGGLLGIDTDTAEVLGYLDAEDI